MSKLSDLRAKGEIVRLSNGQTLEIVPSPLSEQADLAEMSQEQPFKALMTLVKNSIKRADPSTTDEEIDYLNEEDLKAVTEVVRKVNKLGNQEGEGSTEESSPSKKE